MEKNTNTFSRVLRSPQSGKIGFFIFLIALWFLPKPDDLSIQAWKTFLVFAGTIVGIMTQIYPMGAIALFAICACSLTKAMTLPQALSAFSSPIGWLIFTAFLLARGFIKTGLGTRVAYYFIRAFGKSTLGLGYSLVASEALLSPITPSNTARGAGILYPVASSVSQALSSQPKDGTQRRLGAFLMVLGYQTNVITCALFVTSSAANPLLVQLTKKFNFDLSWTQWAMAACVPGFLSLFLLPLILYWVFPPELKKTPEAPEFATKKLAEMGPVKPQEWLVVATFLVLLVLWVFGSTLGVDATTAALFGLSFLVITNVLTMDDLLKESGAWSTFLWMSTLIMICQALSDSGMVQWFGGKIGFYTQSFPWPVSLSVLVAVNFFIHYIFASTTAHSSALYSMLVSVAIASGAPPVLSILAMVFSSQLCAAITHYGTGPGPVYFGAGYVSLKDWWKSGAVIGVSHLVVWGVVGVIWWKILGLW
jgi:divalent anion:Na+ symporter, DASS family